VRTDKAAGEGTLKANRNNYTNASCGLAGRIFMFEGLMQPMHLLVILFIALLFFGPSKLGELGKGLGDGIRHFKNAMKEGSEPAPPENKTQEQK
jgi:sec-independent protein translocase protein TatA